MLGRGVDCPPNTMSSGNQIAPRESRSDVERAVKRRGFRRPGRDGVSSMAFTSALSRIEMNERWTWPSGPGFTSLNTRTSAIPDPLASATISKSFRMRFEFKLT